ncbi:MAG TPA: polysaccharide deacetylase family protein [Coriobacteriia bacterium]
MQGLENARTKVLLYHDLAALTRGDKGLARDRFRHDLARMTAWGFSFRSMPEFLAGKASGPKDIIITFDDGGRSLLDCALPVLEEFSATATMFVVAAFVGCKGSHMDFLTWDDLDEVAARGVGIGSHALSHLPLTGSDPIAIQREVFGAAEIFDRHGHAPRTFAYPYGRRSDEAKQVVRDAGFEAAFMIKKGGQDPLEIRRRLLTLAEPSPLLRFYLSDHYFGVRKAIVSTVPERFRREGRPLPEAALGARGFGIDGWMPPNVHPPSDAAS